VHRFYHELEHGLRQARVSADPKGLVHHKVGVGQVTHLAARDALVGRLTQQVAAEEEEAGNAAAVPVNRQLVAGKGRVRPDLAIDSVEYRSNENS
jgi:hypothetical protein